ncbi:MAG: 30S ribosomal protein S16 [Chloroflexi bacterium]|nr:30S ribosomal protein S16 [Chloroflexota bacterium]
MLRIRLRRMGKKGRPYYRIVVTEKRNPRDGAYIDGIGHYDPMADPPAVTLDENRAVEWLRKGAQPSDPVRQIFERNDIFSKVNSDERAD